MSTSCPRRSALLLRALLAVALLVPVGALTTGPAEALSCVGPERVLQDAEQVFTGRVVDAEDSLLLVEVEEVWSGAPVEERVRLAVDLEGWSAWAGPDGEVPDGYSSPTLWLFAPSDGAVSPCSAWVADERPVRRLHPGVTVEPVAGGPTEASPAGGVLAGGQGGAPSTTVVAGAAVGIVALLGGVVAAVVLRRRRR